MLGVIDADLSLAAVDAQMAKHRAHLILFMALTTAMIWLVSMVFVWGVVYRPVKELTQAPTAWRMATWSTAFRCGPTTN